MPLLRYFVFVGGALLALLFVCDAVLPTVPLPRTLVTGTGSEFPAIRIRSQRKLPERVVFDTSAPVTAPVAIAKADAVVPVPASAAYAPAKARVREAFAQLPAQPLTEAAPSAPTKADAKPQPKRRVAKARNPHPLMLVAQQPRFGLFTW